MTKSVAPRYSFFRAINVTMMRMKLGMRWIIVA